MKSGIVFAQMLRERRRGILLWSLAMATLSLVTAASYPAIKESGSALDELMESMPEGMMQMLGAADGITSPPGYLNSQFYSNVFPFVLLIAGIAAAAWAIAGSEREGTLESLLANPVHRSRVALERLAATTILVALLTALATALLIAVRSPFELSALSVSNLTAAGVGSFLLAMLFASITFAVGAASGSKGFALAAGAGLATATYVLFGLSSLVDFFHSVRWASPWYWFLSTSPLTGGWTFAATLLPLLIIAPVVAIGTYLFTRRDLT